MSPKNLKNTVLHPRKPQFGWGKTMGCEKPLFLQENMKTIFGIVFQGGGWCRWHCFLQGKSKILIDFCAKKKHFCGVHFGSIQSPPEHQTLFFAMNLHDFTKCVFEAQKCPKTSRRKAKMASESPVMAPDSTPTQHPIRVCDRTKLLLISNLQA